MEDRERIVEQEITELAEVLYNFRESLGITEIKHNIQSFLLANHYTRQPEPAEDMVEAVDDAIAKYYGYQDKDVARWRAVVLKLREALATIRYNQSKG